MVGPIIRPCNHNWVETLKPDTKVCSHCGAFRSIRTEAPIADSVNHPPHYTQHPSGVECITITEHHNFNVGNAIKYLWRSGLKEGIEDLEDLKKAVWYINREIERRQPHG